MNPADLLPHEILLGESDPVLDFDSALEQAARALDVEPWVLQRLKHPEREITVNLPLTRDDGSTVNVTGHRVQHSRAQGPSIGPVLLSPKSHLASLRTMAAQITLQSALLGLRLGGAAGAIVIDRERFSERELRHVVKDYVVSLRENTGPLRDALAADNEWLATWMADANTVAHGETEPAAVVGKNPELGRAVSDALVALIEHALAVESVWGLRIAVQGFGRRARSLAGVLHERGACVTAIADRSGAILAEDGIDIAALCSYVDDNGVVFGFAGGDAATNAEMLESPCDVLILAAAERQVGQQNAHGIRARLVVVLTQGAVTPVGEEALPRQCLLLPHLLAGAPELCVWSHEWQRGLSYSEPDPQQAARDAIALTLHAFDRARKTAKECEVTLRQGAMMSAVERLAMNLRKR
jgi:glutamate dehydrogenase (NAD(P)+)